jgi:hypothetical protein
VNLVVLAGVVPVPFGGLFLPHPEPFCHPRDAPHGRFAAAPRRRWARGRGRVSSRPTGSFRHALCRTTRCPRGLKTRLASYVKPSREVLLAHLRQISALLDRHSHAPRESRLESGSRAGGCPEQRILTGRDRLVRYPGFGGQKSPSLGPPGFGLSPFSRKAGSHQSGRQG